MLGSALETTSPPERDILRGSTFLVLTSGMFCVDEAELKQPCTSESREKRMEADKSNLACAAFLDIEFHKCTQ
ncbi:hypothetical protein CEXT_399311 [Caerostris extrusa]|uniref:Uncharacterized protein n=1 Tax=Caerostris extrusa TaxID=172846 RepID=A0AAV4W2Q5_CAEEX|nr:hypothetical protein CEXT_399311 [Caerostris extrusa]